MGGAADDQQTRALAPRLETWLTLRFAANMPYDQLVRELLLARSANPVRPQQLQADGIADPAAFYQASGGKPEQLAANTSRVFLGLQVQCAECHDHPHRHWKRAEFWSFASLFAGFNDRQMAAANSAANAANAEAPPVPMTNPTLTKMLMRLPTPPLRLPA